MENERLACIGAVFLLAHLSCRIGIVAALASEWNTGVGVLQQVKAAPIPIAVTFATFIVASIVPSVRGVSPEKADRWDRPLRDLFSEKVRGKANL
jgi:hypothetical protein